MAQALPQPTGLLFRLLKRRELAKAPADAPVVPFERLVAEPAPDFRPADVDPEEVAVLQYTGGTTGVPKGAMLTHRNLVANREQVIARDPHMRRGGERMLGVLPLFHVFAMTVVTNVAIGLGAGMILLPRFNLRQVLRTIRKKRPTLFPVVPTLLGALLESPQIDRYDLRSLRFCISGGAPLPVEIKERFEARTGCVVVEGYGLTEASPVVTCNPVDGRARAGSIGVPVPGTLVGIRDLGDPHRSLPAGEKGELCVRGPQVTKGYWNRPEETEKTFVDGWLRTGDVGTMDGDGYVYLVDRIKDLIIVHGYNVYPRIVEEAIYEHGAVAEATVIGVPDPHYGQIPKAFVKLVEGGSLSAEELVAFLKTKLSPHEVPREIEFRDSLPKTMIGKLSKKELVAEEMAKRQAAGRG
jgi:long-chain acyl-CoA synthetase